MDANCYFAMGLFIIQGFIGLGLVYQVLYFAQLIVFQGGGRFQSLAEARTFPAQSARLCLIRCAHSQSSCADCPLYRYGNQVADLSIAI